MEHGGYRRPSKPAVVSGPGAHSRRTDGGVSHQALSAVPDQGYGEAKQQLDAQRIAPMAGAAPMPQPAPMPQGGGGAPQGGASAGMDFAGPSQRPDEPITHGVDIGPGAGSEALMFRPAPAQPEGYLTTLLSSLAPGDMTGSLGQLYQIAKQRGV